MILKIGLSMNLKMVTIIGVMVVHNLFASNKSYLTSFVPQSTVTSQHVDPVSKNDNVKLLSEIYRRVEIANRSGIVTNRKGSDAVSATKRVRQRLTMIYGQVGTSFPLMFKSPLIRKQLSYQSLFFSPFFNSINDREMVQIMINCLHNIEDDDESA